MSVPKYYEMYKSFLKTLLDGSVHSMKETKQQVIKDFHLSENELSELLPSGNQTVFDSRIGWCRTYLKKAGLIISPARAQFEITTEGKKIFETVDVIDDNVLMQFTTFREFKHGNSDVVSDTTPAVMNVSDETPQEAMDRVYKDIKLQLADELLTMVMNQTPDFFEALVVKLLEKMGYGGSLEGAGVVTQSSRDEGIDGIIHEDKLGFDQIYIQAKRWDTERTVGRPEIQKFVGALAGQGATKGLFITTAQFSKEAKEYAKKQHTTKIILVDGKKLTELMIEYELGVATEYTYRIKKIDSDFFNEE